MTIFQLDAAVLDSNYRADVTALHVLDDQAHIGRVLG
jgi:hypothetical protein